MHCPKCGCDMSKEMDPSMAYDSEESEMGGASDEDLKSAVLEDLLNMASEARKPKEKDSAMMIDIMKVSPKKKA